MAVQIPSCHLEVVSLLLKEGARADIIDNVSSIIHVHVHVYLFIPLLTEQMFVYYIQYYPHDLQYIPSL